MKIYIAKDWTGVHVFSNPPQLKQCGGLPDIWCGHRLKLFDSSGTYAEDEIPRGKYIEREVWWSIVTIVKNEYEIEQP